MLRRIPRYPRTISTSQLVERLQDEGFAVTSRTVERDLDKLSTAFGYSSEPRGRANPRCWPADYQAIDIPGPEPNAVLAFNLAERHLADQLPPSTLNLLAPYFERARDVLEHQSARPLTNWKDKIRGIGNGPQFVAAQTDETTQRDVRRVVSERRATIRNPPRNDEGIKGYEFSPLGLVSRQGVIYPVGPYGNPRTLCNWRCIAAHRPANFTLDRYVGNEFEFSYATGQGEIRLVLSMEESAALHWVERPLAHDQTIEARPEGGVRLSATVLLTDEPGRRLPGLGPAVEVEQPPSVRARIGSALKAAVRHYA